MNQRIRLIRDGARQPFVAVTERGDTDPR